METYLLIRTDPTDGSFPVTERGVTDARPDELMLLLWIGEGTVDGTLCARDLMERDIRGRANSWTDVLGCHPCQLGNEKSLS